MTAVAARCKARTKAGKPCRSKAVAGTTRCRRHAPTVKSAELTPQATVVVLDGDPSELPGPNERAVLRTLRALGHDPDQDDDDEEDAARFQMLRSLAAAVDANPTRAALWSAYREALKELTDDDGDRSLEEAAAALARAAEVGNT